MHTLMVVIFSFNKTVIMQYIVFYNLLSLLLYHEHFPIVTSFSPTSH